MNLSATAIADALGVTRQAVNKAARRGRIVREPDGKFDLDKVRRAWGENCDVHQQQRSKKAGGRHRSEQPVNTPRPEPSRERSEPDAADASQHGSAPIPENGTIAEAQRLREWERLAKERLLRQKLEGSLVDASEVEARTESRFRAESKALLDWPARVAADIAAELALEERIVHAVLDKYIRQFMRERSTLPVALAAVPFAGVPATA